MDVTFDGYHGTSAQAALEIQRSAFNESNSTTEWLGRGVYFFVDGVSDPIENAKNWAQAQAWNNDTKSYFYHDYVVLKSSININPDNLIDLSHTDGLKTFNDLKERVWSKIEELFSTTIPPNETNCRFFNFMVGEFEADAVKHHLYIKPRKERRLKMRLLVPNTTVLCVLNKAFNSNAEQIYTGKV